MGIKNLTSFLKSNCPQAIKEITLRDLEGKKVAVDISIFLYKFKYKSNNLIPKFVEQINKLRIHNITPIYIFDGVPSIEKKDVILDRKEKLNFKQKQIEALQLSLEKETDLNKIYEIKTNITKINRKILKVTKEDIESVKTLFNNLNIKYVRAQGEADFLCSKLCNKGIVDFVITEDMDLLTSGSKLLLRDFSITSNRALLFNLDEILTGLNLSYEKWVELCIMFGCDYLKRINGIGPAKSLKFIRSFNNINEIINEIKKKNTDIEENYIEKFNNAKKKFMEYDISYLNCDLSTLVSIEPLFTNQKETIFNYLKSNTLLSEKQISNRIKNIYNNIC